MSREEDRLRRLAELYNDAEESGADAETLSRFRAAIAAQQERLAAESAEPAERLELWEGIDRARRALRERSAEESVNTRRESLREWIDRWITSGVGAAPALPFHAPPDFVRAAVDQASRRMRDRATLPPEARATADALDALERQETERAARAELEALCREFLDSVEALGEPSIWDARVREEHRPPGLRLPMDSVDAQAGQRTPLISPEPSPPDRVRSMLAQARAMGQLSEAEFQRLNEATTFNRSLAQQREEWERTRASMEEHAAALQSLTEARAADAWQIPDRVVDLVALLAEMAERMSGTVAYDSDQLTPAILAAGAREIEQAARSLRVELEGSPEPKPKPRTLPEGPISSERFRGLLDEREEDA